MSRFFVFILIPCLLSPLVNAAESTGLQKRRIRRDEAKNAKLVGEQCSSYGEELKELGLTPKIVKRFREEYLKEQVTELLPDFAHLWNFVHATWESAAESDKKVIVDYRRDYRQRRWYHRTSSAYERERGFSDLRAEYRARFRKFVEKYFILDEKAKSESVPEGAPLAFELRRGKGDVVFQPGSRLELEDGELGVARHSRLQLPKEMGGFVLELSLHNDVYASKIKVASQRGNFAFQKPTMAEILESARRWARVAGDDLDLDRNEIRLELLLDERFEKCELGENRLSQP